MDFVGEGVGNCAEGNIEGVDEMKEGKCDGIEDGSDSCVDEGCIEGERLESGVVSRLNTC